jgi:hypothetical protein
MTVGLAAQREQLACGGPKRRRRRCPNWCNHRLSWFQLEKMRLPLCASGRMGPNVEQTPRRPRLQLSATSSITPLGHTAFKVR